MNKYTVQISNDFTTTVFSTVVFAQDEVMALSAIDAEYDESTESYWVFDKSAQVICITKE